MVTLGRKQSLVVLLSRVRVATALLLLVFSCAASTILLKKDTIPEASLGVPDEVTVLDSCYARLRPSLPRGVVGCFRGEPDMSRVDFGRQWFIAQYGLAPSLLTAGSDCEFFIEVSPQGPSFRMKARDPGPR